MATTASTVAEQVGVAQVAPGRDEFRSTSLPIRMGNVLPIAYGGCAISVAVHAAVRTAPDTHRLYSVVGHFHGPASLDQPFRIAVTRTRDTRSFATRRVRVSQLQPLSRKSTGSKTTEEGGGQQQTTTTTERLCLELIADFHVLEEALMEFSPPLHRPHAPPSECPTRQELQAEIEARVGHPLAVPGPFRTVQAGSERFFELRYCRDSMSGQNLGFARDVPTDQDALPLAARCSAEWYRVLPAREDEGGKQQRLPVTHGEQCAVLAFLMDGGLSFAALVHDHLGFEDAGAASSLDFALRFMTPDVDMTRWHVRERIAHAGGAGRTYAEGRLFDEQGRLVASMTQQGIMRPPPKKAKAAL